MSLGFTVTFFCLRTGSGKSTLFRTMMRLLNISEGNIFVDDVNIFDLPLEVLRKGFAVIPQVRFLF